jgi:hypothetical protein
MSLLQYLAATAASHHAVFVRDDINRAIFEVTPLLASGAPARKFLIEITRVGNTAKAGELEPRTLPAFCPERHINFDGSFCLYWTELEPHTINSDEAAAEWWGKLLIFLLRQGVASATRSWPARGDARAHGPEAARFQAVAEFNASTLGKAFIHSLEEQRFSTKEKRVSREGRVRLLLDGRRMLSVDRGRRCVMTLRQRCKCDPAGVGTLPISACADHARALAEFTLALDGWRAAEQQFFDDFKGSSLKCCGTMDNCPLADLLGVQLDEAA